MSEELLPCPFCGGVGVVSYNDRHKTFTSFCDNPDCMMEPETSGFDTYLDAADSWNTRTLPADVEKVLMTMRTVERLQVNYSESPSYGRQATLDQAIYAAIEAIRNHDKGRK